MAREKIKRNLEFRPIVKRFSPTNQDPKGSIKLLHEEMEAIYLSDVLVLYQEEAAQKMRVSRPTYRRILTSARAKVAQALVSGFLLEIENLKEEYRVAVCKERLDSYESITSFGRYIDIFQIHQGKAELIKNITIDYEEIPYKPALILPKIFAQESVNCLITSTIGEGLRSALLTKGVETLLQQSFEKEQLVTLFKTL